MRYVVTQTKAAREAAILAEHREQQRRVAELGTKRMTVTEANRLLYGYADEDERGPCPSVARISV